MKTPANPTLDWGTFGWENFEVVTMQVAENLLPGLVLDVYLNKGSAQEGIDLIQRSRTDGSQLTFQCKREKKLTESDIDTLVEKFLADDKSRTSTDFYLVTAASLRPKKLNKTLENWKKRLKNKKINFDWWDKGCIENHLQSMYSIVERYFGSIQATVFCNRETLSPTLPFDPPENPIARKMGRFIRPKSIYEAFFLRPEDHGVSLVDVVLKDRLKTYRVCLLAEPHQGKTTYLQQCAVELLKSGNHVCPIYLDIKEANVRSIEEMLTGRYRGWGTVPFKDIVLLVDGLDEAPANEVVRLARYVAEFGAAHPSISIIVSCRTLFYNHYSLEETLGGFPTFLLLGLEWTGIDRYVRSKLGDLAGDFLTLVKKKQLEHWLYHPFYLVSLLEYFGERHQLPRSKLEVINYFIDQAYQKSKHRLLGNGSRLQSQAHFFNQVVKKLAIVMQLRGVSALPHEDFQPFFTSKEAELLQDNSIVSLRDTYWVFTNSFFQEHLAADYLASLPLDQITKLISAGKATQQIHIRWIQTAASVLSLLPKGSAKYNGLLAFIKADSIELVFQTDPTLHTETEKMALLQELFAYLTANNIWPMNTDPEEVGLFMSGVSDAVPYLIDQMTDNHAPPHSRRVAAKTLSGITDLTGWEPIVLVAVHETIGNSASDFEAADLVRLLASHHFGSEADVEKIIKTGQFATQLVFRDAMYQWIIALGLTRKFWNYGIQGIAVLASHDQSSKNRGSRTMLDAFLLNIHHRHQLYTLFDAINEQPWFELNRYDLSKKDGFLAQLLQKCAALYLQDNWTILPMIHFMRGAGRRYFHQFPEVFNEFLAQTRCQLHLIIGLREEIFGDRNSEFGQLALPETFDFILWEFDQIKGHHPDRLRRLHAGMNSQEKFEGSFKNVALGATADPAFQLYDDSEALQIRETERKRRDNDLHCIQSVAAFRKAVRAVFRLHHKEKLTAYELHAGHQTDSKGINCHFTTRFIDSHCRGMTVSLPDCLESLKDDDQFEYFRAHQIMEYPFKDDRIETSHAALVKEYYFKHLPNCQFTNAYSENAGRWMPREKEELIARIFQKYLFATEPRYLTEFLWLDNSGMRDGSVQSYRNADLLRDKVLAQMAGREKQLRQAIAAHLKTGIASKRVLMTHIDLCQKLLIGEAKPLVFQILKNWSFDDQDHEKVANVYLTLGGTKKELLPFLDSASTDDSFWCYLMNVLAEDFQDLVIEHGIRFLSSANQYTTQEMRIAYLMIKLGQVEGLQFLIQVLTGKRHPGMILHDGNSFIGLDTHRALAELKSIMYFVIDPRYANIPSPDSPKGLVLDWLGAFANKGEDDLQLVLQFLREAEETWEEAFPEGARNLRGHSLRLLDRFRGNHGGSLTAAEVRDFLIQTQPWSPPEKSVFSGTNTKIAL